MTNVEQYPTKKNVLLVSFFYEMEDGVLSTWRLTNANTDQFTRLGKFLTDPALKATLPINAIGEFGRDSAQIDISYGNWLFAPTITDGRAFAPIDVFIQERQLGESEDNIRPLFFGRVASTERFPNNKQEIARIVADGDKNRLNQALGFSANAFCGWTFGDAKTCGFDIDVKRETGLLSIPNLKSTKVTITGLASHPNRYWRRGWVSRGALKLRIREWLNGTDFILSQLPPQEWDGQNVTVRPGCDKRIFTCRFWGREESFSGIGFDMPAYNPLFENPG